VKEPNDMYALLAATGEIPVTKVILVSAGHYSYYNRVVGADPGDTIDTANDPRVPVINDKQVQEAMADYFLAHL
jgi:hypothetical protein